MDIIINYEEWYTGYSTIYNVKKYIIVVFVKRTKYIVFVNVKLTVCERSTEWNISNGHHFKRYSNTKCNVSIHAGNSIIQTQTCISKIRSVDIGVLEYSQTGRKTPNEMFPSISSCETFGYHLNDNVQYFVSITC